MCNALLNTATLVSPSIDFGGNQIGRIYILYTRIDKVWFHQSYPFVQYFLCLNASWFFLSKIIFVYLFWIFIKQNLHIL